MSKNYIQTSNKLKAAINIECSKRKISADDRKDMMEGWGYGRTLKGLSIPCLVEIKNLISGGQQYDEQYSPKEEHLLKLMTLAGWNIGRVKKYIDKKFGKSRLTSLTEKERKQLIAVLKTYGAKNES